MARRIVDTVIIGAGQSGLAVSALLTAAGRDHVVFDRGGAGQRWRTDRWDSLRLLTPNWLSRLPGWSYDGTDPDGFMTAGEVAAYLGRFARSFGAPIVSAEVHEVWARPAGGYDLRTDDAAWHTRHVVIATGAHARQVVPTTVMGARVEVVKSRDYRNPRSLPDGGVLVVGGSSTGVQIADELVRDGRRVVLAVGRHSRMPRTYRGRDIFWWLHRLGVLARSIDEVRDPAASSREPSLQLVGSSGKHTAVDLWSLRARGVQLTGRLLGIDGAAATFDAGLPLRTVAADAAMTRILDAVDLHISRTRTAGDAPSEDRPQPFVADRGPSHVDLRREGITAVVLATGLLPDYRWLRAPVVGRDGLIVQRRGVTSSPGLYVVGQPFQHRRDATYIDGARHNAGDVVAHLCAGGRAGQEAIARLSLQRAASRS